MNEMTHKRFLPLSTESEQLLALTAIKIELLPSQYQQLLDRKSAIENHLERKDSQLKGKISLFYQQGSVAIGATIRSMYRDEGFDIDIVVESNTFNTDPTTALNLLYASVRGDPESRYYNSTKRQSRCVTIEYADGMHIDLTPSVLIDENDPRKSVIFHSKPNDQSVNDERIIMNSYGFVDHYMSQCPKNPEFAKEYRRLVDPFEEATLKKIIAARSEPAPKQSTLLDGKSTLTVALQLLKRFRNIKWKARNGRMPASVMFSCLVLEVAEQLPRGGGTIGHSLELIVSYILKRLQGAKQTGKLIEVRNPCCKEDIFTDRWPASLTDQNQLIEDMEEFLTQLRKVLDESTSLAVRIAILKVLFGEAIAESVQKSFDSLYEKRIKDRNHSIGPTGGVITAPSIVMPAAARPHTFHGSNFSTLPQKNGRKMKSLQEQVSQMKNWWPNFEFWQDSWPDIGKWIGEIKGMDRPFKVSVQYGLPKEGRTEICRIMPIVRVLSPELVLRPHAEQEAPLPHVYPEPGHGFIHSKSPLCLFDPRKREWDHSKSLARTTMQWIARWLACYEIWEASGRWVGGGSHEH